MAQTRAVENYRRRIYDSWSVLRAAQIIIPVDTKRYAYNSRVIEGDFTEATDVRPTVRKEMSPLAEAKINKFVTFVMHFQNIFC